MGPGGALEQVAGKVAGKVARTRVWIYAVGGIAVGSRDERNSMTTLSEALARNLEELTALTRDARADRWRATMVPMTTREGGR